MRNFNDIYEKVYRESAEIIEKNRKPIRNKMIIFIVFIVMVEILVIAIIKDVNANILITIPSIWCLKLLYDKEKKYKKFFKEKVIENFVKEYDKTFCYIPDEGISDYIYEMARFEKISYNKTTYHSEDLIKGNLDGKCQFSMAEVYVREGRKKEDIMIPIFRGLFIKVEMNVSINTHLKIRKNTALIYDENEDKKVKMDSNQFTKKAYVYATDKIIAMQLLTADVMEMLLEFEEKTNIMPEITLEGNRLYIRFATGNIFEPKIFKNTFDYGTLKKYYDIINFTLNITKQLVKNIKETEL